jgi:hypothetical protein
MKTKTCWRFETNREREEKKKHLLIAASEEYL